MEFKELRQESGMNMTQFGKYFEIPFRTIQNWENGSRKCPEYLLKLMQYKLENEGIIKKECCINIEKLQQFIDEGFIIEFENAEECRQYFNIYDFQNFKTVDEMKEYQDIYGFGHNGKWYHIDSHEGLDIYNA